MQAKLEQCPDAKKLADFLLGKLPRNQNESYESHIAECPPCVETIRNLNVDDTLNELMDKAWSAADDLPQSNSESQFLDGLIGKMRDIGQPSASQNGVVGSAGSSQLQDRAVEVQRLIEPARHTDDLGQLDHYRIQELLGAGSTGVVYRAIDEQLQRTVAIKILRPSLGTAARERFIAEARATATIDHPNVITIYQVGSAGPLAYIAMQWLPGETLDQRLQRETTLPVEELEFLSRQIAEGLSAAHAKGLIHRDIKPANIWLEADRTHARILDFGLVRITDEDPQLTCTGMIAGTPCYMSPEQSRGSDLDERSDIFSLGCLMYQALTGRLPFRSSNALATLQSIQRDQPTPPTELDPGIRGDLSDLVMCLLEKSPNKRPSSAVEVAEAIDSERSDWAFPVDQYGSLPLPKPKLHSNSFWRKGWVAALALLALGIGGMLFGPQIIRVATNQGELTIESFDENIKIEVLQNGELVRVIDLKTDQRVNIVAGNYEIRPINGDDTILIDKEKLTMSRGGKVTVKVSRQAAPSLSASGSEIAELSDTHRNSFRKLQSRVFRDRANAAQLAKSGKISVGYQVLNTLRTDIENSGIPKQITSRLHAMVASDIDRLQQSFEPLDSNNLKSTTNDQPYTLDEGDLLGIYIEGVLGEAGEAPPVHYPDPASGLPPCIGYPIPVRSDGKISLPLVEMISVRGKTIEEVEEGIKRAYFSGASPILIEDRARIIVSLMRQRDYFALPKSSGTSPKAILDVVPKAGHQLDSGDIVGVFIDGVLGSFSEDPPIHYPAPETGLPPSIGFPIPVRADGKISLPLVELISVRGKTIEEVEALIKDAFYSGDQPILNTDGRILVNLMRVRPKTNENKNTNSQ